MAEQERQESLEREAREMGWSPKEEWRGDEAHWVDAATFVERGRTVLPILRKTNGELRAQIGTLQQEMQSMKSTLQAANATIQLLHESHEEDVEERVKAAREDLKRQLVTASKDGDHEAVAELTDKLTELNTAEREAGKEKKAAEKTGEEGKTADPAQHPEYLAWAADNPWVNTDPKRARRLMVVMQDMRDDGDKRIGRAFMDDAVRKMDEEFGYTRKARGGDSKVEGGNGGESRSSSGNQGRRGYADLPAEAKQVCDRQAQRMVGPNRKHKDVGSWQSAYAQLYFSQSEKA